ncbi:MAG: hypothetical protein DPW18_20140, partial [Chloroflexi bacterium]|nr:hypothetical protein [Chloroflexota bacterium]
MKKSIHITWILVILVSLLGSTPTQAARAATEWMVTTTSDSGPGSLRQAIADASDGDTITFDPSLAGQTVHLASPLLIDKGITIDGTSLSLHVKISGDTNNDGTGDVAVFQIGGPSSVELNHLDIVKGKGVGATGGGGIANYGILIIRNSNISDNTYVNGLGGGGIYNKGELTIIDSTLTGNSAFEGGAIFNELNQPLTITGTTFSNNQALTEPGQPGGAAGAIGNIGTMTVTDSVFTNNFSHGGGGAIVNSINGTAAISHSAFDGNSTSGKGGAIANPAGSVTIENCTFTDNEVYYEKNGGAIYNEDQLTITGSTFTGNEASHGGAIANFDNLSLSDSVLSSNNGDLGGGIINGGTATIANTAFIGNNATMGGGAIVNHPEYNGTVTITNSTISDNTAPNGGGIHNLTISGTVNISNSLLSGNSASGNGGSGGNGGGISNFGNLELVNTTFFNNSSPLVPNSYGGGVFNTGTLTITNSTFSENSAHIGGGIANFNNLHYTNTIIANSTSGGDCYNENGTVGTNSNNLVEINAASPYQCGIPLYAEDPQLGPLADNGGSTQTMSLLPGSPAIDAGGDDVCTDTDQRGATRPMDGDGDNTATCDIGAFESGEPTTTIITADTPDPSMMNQNVAVTVTVSGGSSTPVGTVDIIGADTNCTVTLSDGTGSCDVVFTSSGNKTLTATYNGDLSHSSSADTETHLVITSLTLRSQGGNDGWILESSETSGAGGTMNSSAATFNLGDDAANRQYRTILHFDTSALPDNAVITSAVLKIRK